MTDTKNEQLIIIAGTTGFEKDSLLSRPFTNDSKIIYETPVEYHYDNIAVINSDLINLFSETFGIAEENMLPGATLESLGLDSLAVIEFLFQIEDKFGIKIPDQVSPPRTLDEMVQMIEPLMPKHPAGTSNA